MDAITHVPPIRLAVTIFSGFLQRLGSPGSGFAAMERSIQCAMTAAGRCDADVRMYPWKTCVSDVAEPIWRYRPSGASDGPQVHLVAGYSYGGQTAVNFCRELATRPDCRVAELWLCDPVRRWRFLPGVAAGLGVGRLAIPRNVSRVTVFRQRNPRWAFDRGLTAVFDPAGHDVEAENPLSTPEIRVVECDEGHRYMDDVAAFRIGFVGAVLKAMGEISNSKTKGRAA